MRHFKIVDLCGKYPAFRSSAIRLRQDIAASQLPVIVDFKDVENCSLAFIDECFGVLAEELKSDLSKEITFKNCSYFIMRLLDFSISERLR